MLRLRKFLTVLFVYIALLVQASSLKAHPHNWIVLNSRFVLDDEARLVAIHQRWEFDFYYSLMMHADLLNEYGSEDVGLPATADSMIKNLESHHYFSKLKLGDTALELGVPDQFQLSTKNAEGQLILVLDMTFSFDQETKIENQTLIWQVYDPTYYIAMNHTSENNIEIVGGNATECSKQLQFAEPSDELIDYAQSLDRAQKDTKGLGASFAETALINCV